MVAVKHDLDIIAEADRLIDLKPEGGDGYYRVMAQGTPEEIAGVRQGSHTARILGEFLWERGGRS